MPRNYFIPDLTDVTIRNRGHLPHWERPDAIYSITYRLHDSLPLHVILRLQEERRSVVNGARTAIEKIAFRQEFERRIDVELDASIGACHMRNPRIAEIVAENLHHFDGTRYHLLAWCVMPNHVHVVMHAIESSLATIVQSWKSYTSKRANEILGREGTFWQREYFDRIVRDTEDLRRTIEYVVANPTKAGLRDWRWVSAGQRPA